MAINDGSASRSDKKQSRRLSRAIELFRNWPLMPRLVRSRRNIIWDLGVKFHLGDKIPQDLAKAAVIWRQATKAGDIPASNNLVHLTYYGRGVRRDPGEGVCLWRVAAIKGFSESQIHLAYAYTDGE